MSESTTKSAKKDAPKAKAETKAETKAEPKAESAPAEKSTKGVAAAAHSPSYFSSVSSAEYRAGWDSVFTARKAKKT